MKWEGLVCPLILATNISPQITSTESAIAGCWLAVWLQWGRVGASDGSDSDAGSVSGGRYRDLANFDHADGDLEVEGYDRSTDCICTIWSKQCRRVGCLSAVWERMIKTLRRAVRREPVLEVLFVLSAPYSVWGWPFARAHLAPVLVQHFMCSTHSTGQVEPAQTRMHST